MGKDRQALQCLCYVHPYLVINEYSAQIYVVKGQCVEYSGTPSQKQQTKYVNKFTMQCVQFYLYSVKITVGKQYFLGLYKRKYKNNSRFMRGFN